MGEAADSRERMGGRLAFGVDWYPEQWDEGRWEADADRMADYGFEVARIMEFAWALIEPEKGRFDFSLFDRAVSVLARRGIGVILGTPTATFPAWLLDEGDVLQVARDGTLRDFGTRRMGCFNSPAYREAARRVVEACAAHFGKDERVIGWQVDNELGHEGSDRCVCDTCRDAWRAWLERRYGNTAAMNAEWGNVFWGASYSRWDQVPVPRDQVSARFNPGLLLDYDRFCSDSAIAFSDLQVGILRAASRPGAFITTNLFPPPMSNAIDLERLTRGMDFASWDNYPSWGDQDEPLPYVTQSLAESFIRDLSPSKRFAVMEAFSGFQGHVCLGYLPPERQVALWTNQAIARGADRVLYFRWRTAPYGQEQLCYGLFDTDDAETERARVLRDNTRAVKATFSRFASTPIESPACLVYSKDDARALTEQYLSKGLYLKPVDWAQAGYDMEMIKWFAPYVVFNVNADVMSVESVDVEKYRIISLPLYQMADPALVERLDAWVRKGGHLVLGYRAGARDMRNWNVAERLPGLFSEMAGIRVPRFESLNLGTAGIRIGPFPAKAGVWADIIEPDGAKPIAIYADRRKFYSGLPCATVNARGEGKVWYVGTSPDPLGIFLLYRRILGEAKVGAKFRGAGIEVIERRTDEGGIVKVILNHNAKARRVLGRRIAPYGWAVIE
jgi:beta-galactosidase